MTPRLLYLDDNPSNVKLMRMLLSLRAEVLLSVARDGAEGLSLALAEPLDLVLVDLHPVSYTHLTLPTKRIV